MKIQKHFFYLLILGIFLGYLFHANILNHKQKSNELILQKNGEQITLDFSETLDGNKIQFFNDYFIESTTDSITIYRNK
ncbi:MAG: hypothetical protein Q4D45_08360 [Lachnospiraceae bacterium]|nr:hypothetical protein [Lachnospiraceae bacterium]